MLLASSPLPPLFAFRSRSRHELVFPFHIDTTHTDLQRALAPHGPHYRSYFTTTCTHTFHHHHHTDTHGSLLLLPPPHMPDCLIFVALYRHICVACMPAATFACLALYSHYPRFVACHLHTLPVGFGLLGPYPHLHHCVWLYTHTHTHTRLHTFTHMHVYLFGTLFVGVMMVGGIDGSQTFCTFGLGSLKSICTHTCLPEADTHTDFAHILFVAWAVALPPVIVNYYCDGGGELWSRTRCLPIINCDAVVGGGGGGICLDIPCPHTHTCIWLLHLVPILGRDIGGGHMTFEHLCPAFACFGRFFPSPLLLQLTERTFGLCSTYYHL